MTDEIINTSQVGDKERNPSSGRKLNPRLPNHRVGTLSTEQQELMESEAIQLSSYVARVLHTAGSSNVDIVYYNDVKERELLNFKLGNVTN